MNRRQGRKSLDIAAPQTPPYSLLFLKVVIRMYNVTWWWCDGQFRKSTKAQVSSHELVQIGEERPVSV